MASPVGDALRSHRIRLESNRTIIGVLGSECLDRRSSHRAWIGDRESGSALVANRRAWIGVLLTVLGSETESGSALVVDQRAWIGVLGSAFFSSCLDQSSSRRRAPCLDRKFKKFGIERSENLGIERSFRETLKQSLMSGERERLVSGEWRERV
uniref:Uncharacterized protein n=1 Tax=Quercus lobata TaxID=97700 RepID=A0A7N2LDL7_QUELO